MISSATDVTNATVTYDDRRIAYDAEIILAHAGVAIHSRGQWRHRDGDRVDQGVRRALARYHVTARGSIDSRWR